jgi:hypothetical protein
MGPGPSNVIFHIRNGGPPPYAFAVRPYLAAVVVIMAACSSASQGAGQPPPSPIQPRDANLTISGVFVPFKNQYGDPLEALNLHISSNIPVPFKVEIAYSSGPEFAIHSGKADEQCGASYGCLVKPATGGLDDFYCDKACAGGEYVFDARVCSYNSDQFFDACKEQTSEYVAWVGKLGQNLNGNPIAKPDRQHPAILDLTLEVRVNHP